MTQAVTLSAQELEKVRVFERLSKGIPINSSPFYNQHGIPVMRRKTLNEYFRQFGVADRYDFGHEFYSAAREAYHANSQVDKRAVWDMAVWNDHKFLGVCLHPPFVDPQSPEFLIKVNLLKDDGTPKKPGEKGNLVIESIEVNRHFKRFGIGTQMVENIYRYALEEGYSGIEGIASREDGLKYWPRFASFHQEDMVYGQDLIGRGGTMACGEKTFMSMLDSACSQIKTNVRRQGYELDDKFKESIDRLRYKPGDDHDKWADAFATLLHAHQKNPECGFLWPLNMIEGAHMVCDFSNPEHMARANRYLSQNPASTHNTGFVRTLDKFLKDEGAAVSRRSNYAEMSQNRTVILHP